MSSSIVNQHIDIFIPQKFHESPDSCMFCVRQEVIADNRFMNCTCTFSFKNAIETLQFVRSAQNVNIETELEGKSKTCICFLFHDPRLQNELYLELEESGCPLLLIKFGKSVCVTVINWDGPNSRRVLRNTRIILYDSVALYRSEFLMSGHERSFLDYISRSWKISKAVCDNSRQKFGYLQFCMQGPPFEELGTKIILFIINLLSFVGLICNWCTRRMPNLLLKILNATTTGKQIAFKSYHLKLILEQLSRSHGIGLLSGNLLTALVVDAAFGLLVTCYFQDYLKPAALVEAFISHTDVVVSQLQQLLYWLMGVPAGLKLNLPLNSALGKFFLYHIYLWKTYIELIKPFLLVMLEFSMHFGIFGLSFLISLYTDLLSLATLHIYCFYGYAARIYSLKLSGLIAFWRLFRGKKWNPLRKRVDSFTYDVQQLFLGTLMFTVLVFLLPTVVLYYVVFSVLRLIVLLLQVIMCKLISILILLPLYVIALCLLNHPLVKGDVLIKVASSAQRNVSFSLEVISLPISTVIQRTLPPEQFCTIFGPKHVLNCIITGEILYPL